MVQNELKFKLRRGDVLGIVFAWRSRNHVNGRVSVEALFRLFDRMVIERKDSAKPDCTESLWSID